MTKFTPAPWKLTDEDQPTFVYKLNEKGFNQFHLNVSGCGDHTSIEELHANAKLIAAAPELYECLIEAYAQVKDMCTVLKIPFPKASFERYEAALAKATGE